MFYVDSIIHVFSWLQFIQTALLTTSYEMPEILKSIRIEYDSLDDMGCEATQLTLCWMSDENVRG